ncbi:hypothetical protein IMG5_049950 [Ichthyophthirius multifiliis]|uniref:Uncharacterized protein n=1 Tax=Ichthyophthirius multifiliis TaxID=5932 RepID=G0QML6_ICHMU|nr:hypothetical protein IMG5_049950 [Ichthyophthirius multifiliis]EGR33535.1 hypothetical protein IMG5_049950 [Ichthyophthirius multifiliis]|eukprot:XP_004037521.1 hypothetical protein IMG5_049950 [Ichthyophthirius multifiliis]
MKINKKIQKSKFLKKIRKQLSLNLKNCMTQPLKQQTTEIGESLVLSKEIQQKYESRPVNKDIFICVKDIEAECLDILPKCIFTCPRTARLLFLDKKSHLHQYDLINKKKLFDLDLSVRVPLLPSKILDATFDANSGRLYTLTDKWNMEIWELGQDNNMPLGRIVLFTEALDTENAIEMCYGNRFEGLYPQFIEIGQNSHSVIIVNATCINNTLIFIDPISLSVFQTLQVSPEQFKMSTKLAEVIRLIGTLLSDDKKFFEKLFAINIIKGENGQIKVQNNDFISVFYNLIKSKADNQISLKEELENLVQFLDQNNSGFIEKQEFLFLYEIIKYHEIKKVDNSSKVIKLAGISEGAYKLLISLSNFLEKQKKVLKMLLKHLALLIKDIYHLIDFIDKDKNGLIDYKEFLSIFGIASSNSSNGIQFNSRKNIFLSLQMAYEAGIDVEQQILKEDLYHEGSLTCEQFRNFLKWLPVGLLQEEIDYIMNNSISFTDIGTVNYLDLLNSVEFLNIKNHHEFQKQVKTKERDFFEKKGDQKDVNALDAAMQKVIIESVIYIDDFNLIIYTTICPRSSIICVSRTSKVKKNSGDIINNTDIFTCKILAKLKGHSSCNPPSIFFVPNSGCLISGEKTLNSSVQADCSILIWNLQKDFQAQYETNPPWVLKPSKIIQGAHSGAILSFAYLPFCQLIVSMSADSTIKLWNPLQENTLSNESFCEVKRIYTGNQICYNASVLTVRVPDFNNKIVQFLYRFDDSVQYTIFEDVDALFEVFLRLPSRQYFITFLSEYDVENLKNYIKKEGFNFEREFKQINASEGIQIMNEKQLFISKQAFSSFLQRIKVFTNEQDFILFLSQIDPMFTGKIKLNVLQDKFSSEIIEYKLRQIQKPNELIEDLMQKLDQKQKKLLMFELHSISSVLQGYLTLDEFLKSFLKFDKIEINQLKELFEFYSEKLHESQEKYINIKFIIGKFFSANENFGMLKYLHTMAKIKNSLLDQGYSIEYIFRPLTKEEAEPVQQSFMFEDNYDEDNQFINKSQLTYNINMGLSSIQAGCKKIKKIILIQKKIAFNPLMQMGTGMFIQRIQDLKIPNISEKELKQFAQFISVCDENSQKKTIQLTTFLHYMRKNNIKDQYLISKNIYKEVEYIIQNQNVFDTWISKFNDMNNIQSAQLRYIFGKMDISSDYIDEIIILFLGDKSHISHEELITKFNDYLNQGLIQMQNLENEKIQQQKQQYQQQQQQNQEQDKKFTFTELILSPKREVVRSVVVKKRIFIEELVNFLRTKVPEKIELLISSCENRDSDKKGIIEIQDFCRILKLNIPQISENLILNFQREYINENCQNHFDYQDFFNKYASKQEIEQIKKAEECKVIDPYAGIDVNFLMKRIVEAHKQNPHIRLLFKTIDVDALDRQCTADELLLVYKYFDEKNYGEISIDTFVESFEYIALTSLAKLKQQNEQEIEKAQENNTQQSQQQLQKTKMSNKQLVQGVMQKIFFFMQDKRYNKKQLKAVFDKNGNGFLSREEFQDTLKLLQLQIPNDKVNILLDYIDKDESGQVSIDEFIFYVFDSIPIQYKKMYIHGNVIKIFNDIILKLQNQTSKLLYDLVEQERIVKQSSNDVTSALKKTKSGIASFDFHKVLKNHGIKLKEQKNEEIKNMFTLRSNPDYYDLEQIYDMLDNLIYQHKQSNKNQRILIHDSISNLWEQDIYRKIAEYLRKHNLNVEQAFRKIDQDQSQLISSSEFRRFIESLNLDLSEKKVIILNIFFFFLKLIIIKKNKIEQLIKGFFNGQDQGMISLSAFKNKFWECYIRYGRQENQNEIEDLKANRKKLLLYIYLTLKEFTNNNMEKAWATIDQRKIGYCEIEDFRKSLVIMGVYLTKEELKFAFSFIDKNQDSCIKYLEFVQFWIAAEGKLEGNQNEINDILQQKNLVYELEESIMEHICKVMNQREISLWNCFKYFDKEQLGFLNQKQFKDFLCKIGCPIEKENLLLALMKLIDPKSQEEIIHLSSLESRLYKYGLKIYEQNEVEQIKWIDKPLLSFTSILNKLSKMDNFSIEDFFKKYDSDYDGYLTTQEFFQSFKFLGFDIGITDSQIQRIQVLNTKCADGHDLQDVEYIVLNEKLDCENEYICLQELISQNGGILRMPVLLELQQAQYVIKYIAIEILKIMQVINSYTCVLNILRPENLYISKKTYKIKLANIRGISKYDVYSKIDIVPDIFINLVQQAGALEAKEKLDYSEFFTENTSSQQEHPFKDIYVENLYKQSYLAPEQIHKKTNESSSYIDVWTFGCLLFHLIFGKPPAHFGFLNKETPSKYYHYDVFSDEFVQDVLNFDFGKKQKDQLLQNNYSTMIKAIDKQSFGNVFEEIFGKQNMQELSAFMDIISACLQYQELKRPTIEAILNSKIFQMDEFQKMRSFQLLESKDPYVFSSKHWSPVVFDSLKNLFSATIGEAGVGQGNYIVLQDYIRFSSEKYGQDNGVPCGKNADYFNDLVRIAENLQFIFVKNTLFMSSANTEGSQKLINALNYFKDLLLTNNISKIKLFLDFRIAFFIIPYLNVDNPHVRAVVLLIKFF